MQDIFMSSEADNLKPMSEQVALQSLLIAMQTNQAQLRQVSDNMREMASDLKDVRERVISIEATDDKTKISGLEARLRNVEVAIGRFGLAMAIMGSVGGLAVGVALTKLFLH